jgi:hypothetical protein
MKKQVEQTAWDGEWYLRGFFDNGTPLGSHVNEEARIDSLPQSWAVISGAGDRLRARQAMESAERNLVREKEKLVLLLAPPFNHSVPNPGYIMGYPPGLRENGGQYTHDEDPGDGGSLPGRTVCGRGGRFPGRRQGRSVRLDLVHRFGGMDVPGLDRRSIGIESKRRPVHGETFTAGGVARL